LHKKNKKLKKDKILTGLENGSPTPQASTLPTEVLHDGEHFSKAYQVIVKKLKNKVMYYKETLKC
jgi:hypothetical protein